MSITPPLLLALQKGKIIPIPKKSEQNAQGKKWKCEQNAALLKFAHFSIKYFDRPTILHAKLSPVFIYVINIYVIQFVHAKM